eukprot:XP_011678556.1 PREDICTED: uncharacterized protein LOC105445117 [Strongylocentrotus purpuratus]
MQFSILNHFHLKSTNGDGHFELDVISYVDPRGELADGSCCDPPSSSSSSSSADGIQECVNECDVAFRACLTNFQPRTTYDGRCVFGEGSTDVVGGNTLLSIVDGDIDTRSASTTFSLILEALDVDGNGVEKLTTETASLTNAFETTTSTLGSRNVTFQLIERAYHSGILVPSSSWVALRHDGATATVLYRVRLQCDDDFYGKTCLNYCTPRNDQFGHYTCDDDGGRSTTGDGHFELDVISYVDPRGELADGSCCDPPSSSSSPSSSSADGIQECVNECDVAFRACLTNFQPRTTYDGRCVFGEGSTDVVGGNTLLSIGDGDIDTRSASVNATPPAQKDTTIKFPFDFAWPTTFSLILEALDVDGNGVEKSQKPPSTKLSSPSSSSPSPPQSQTPTTPFIAPMPIPATTETASSTNAFETTTSTWGTRNVTFQLIERAYHSGILVPSSSWVALRHDGATATVLYRVRLQCDDDFYGTTCLNYCTPRDDQFGHYTCDDDGGRVCDHGWTGSHCMIAICKKGCHATYGFCDSPDECRCRHGWQGELCDQCMPYPGCKHGGCVSPWQCNCEYKWGGLLCDQDLDFCGSHTPCQHDAICINIRPNEYACRCTDGFEGQDCELESQKGVMSSTLTQS